MNIEVDEKALERHGFVIGVLGYLIACGILACVYTYAKKVLDADWADILIAVPALFATLVIGPIKNLYVGYIMQKKCGAKGHMYEQFNTTNLSDLMYRKRCGHFQRGGIEKR